MKRHFLLAVSCVCSLVLSAQGQQPVEPASAQTLTSPDGNYLFTFTQKDGRLAYNLTYQGREVVCEGELGVDIDNHLVESAMGIPTDTCAVWTADLRLLQADYTRQDTTWHPLYGEQAAIRDHYNELTLRFIKGGDSGMLEMGYNKNKQYLMDIIVRAYDEGIALRYHFPEATNGLFLHIAAERTSFRFPEGTQAWHEAWAQGPFQEVSLSVDHPAWRDESERPTLLRLPDGLHVALLEAALTDFPRGKYRLAADNTLQVSLFGAADVITEYSTPWRVIMAADRPVDLINHKQLVLNLNAPSHSSLDTPHSSFSWIRPGKAFRSSKLEDAWIRRSIDFAADFGIQYVELDAGWYGPEMQVASDATQVAANRDFSLPDLCRYAASKGVGIWVYVNQRALYRQLDDLLPLYEQWGIKGIKFGFVQIGSQQWTTWLHDAVRKCAEHHLMVDIHDEYRPTGVSRTLPNLLTQEGIRGNEEMPDATHNTILPFTRFLCGPADYTLCYFNGRVKNTKAHQLAMSVVYYSPLQFLFWYDLPDAYKGERELDFWKQCPTVWDESRALDGQPGEYIVQARRAGSDWFVGIMTGIEARDVTLNTADFLAKGKKYRVEIYNDDPALGTRTKVSTQELTLKAGKFLRLHLQPSGGAALRFVPVS